MLYAIKCPDGTIDPYVSNTMRDLWFDRGFQIMRKHYGVEWQMKFWKKEKASINDFKKKGFSFINVKLVEV
jgi:hypothetical protein